MGTLQGLEGSINGEEFGKYMPAWMDFCGGGFLPSVVL